MRQKRARLGFRSPYRSPYVPSMLKNWSEWQDLNLRPPRPERGGLWDIHFAIRRLIPPNPPALTETACRASPMLPPLIDEARARLSRLNYTIVFSVFIGAPVRIKLRTPMSLRFHCKFSAAVALTLNQRVQGSSPCARDFLRRRQIPPKWRLSLGRFGLWIWPTS
jgi:hypothetical protein